jgi:glutathione S-transferase
MAQAKPTAGRLVIGSKRYSYWSLRGWLAVRLAGLEVEELVIPLAGGATPAVKAATPSGTVPFLGHEGARVWESLAIC